MLPRGQFAGHGNARSLCQVIRQSLAALSPKRAIKPERALVLAVAFLDGDGPARYLVAILRRANNGVLADIARDCDRLHVMLLTKTVVRAELPHNFLQRISAIWLSSAKAIRFSPSVIALTQLSRSG